MSALVIKVNSAAYTVDVDPDEIALQLNMDGTPGIRTPAHKGDIAMPIRFGVPELLIILAVVVLLFGVGRIGRVAAEMGKGIRAFREALKDEGKEEPSPDSDEK